MDGEQGKVVVCVDARFTGGSFPLLVLCLYILRILYAGVIVCTMDPECGGNLMVFTRKSVWCFFFREQLPAQIGRDLLVHCRIFPTIDNAYGTPTPENNPGCRPIRGPSRI